MLVDIEHPNAITVWKTIRVDADGMIKTALIVETNLAITEGFEGYDKDAVNALRDHVVEYIKQHNDIDCATFHSLPEYEAVMAARRP